MPGWGFKIDWKLSAALLVVVLALAVIILNVGFIGGSEGFDYVPLKIEKVDHTDFFKSANISTYEGSKTCISCHYDDVVEVFHSYHYQLESVQNDVVGVVNLTWGSKYSYNDFCGNIFWKGVKPVNWIGYVKLKKAPKGYEDLVGSFTGLTGCSMCHGVGMGLPPSTEMSMAQLNNIDCLACHVEPNIYMSGPFGIAKGVRNVSKSEDGRFYYVFNLDIWDVAKNIIKVPRKENCLACHAVSGGGPHLKRPNISPDLMGKDVEESFDVHIASGMSCVDCHRAYDHDFPTSSLDTFDREEGYVPSCTDCHESPHEGLIGWFINSFHDRVACQTCHIPYIASGKYPTDTHRDWSASTFHPELTRWKFSIPDPETGSTDKWYLEGNITPIYLWYNGSRILYQYPEPFTPITEGKYYEMYNMDPVNGESLGVVFFVEPLGGIDDPNAKIYPFKLHTAVVAYSTINHTFVPMKVGIAFATGNTTLAYLKGAEATGTKWNPGEYVTIVRFMQVNHGVAPAENALFCFDCHGFTPNRMKWDELGYGIYPEVMFTTIVVGIPVLIVVAVLAIRRFYKP